MRSLRHPFLKPGLFIASIVSAIFLPSRIAAGSGPTADSTSFQLVSWPPEAALAETRALEYAAKGTADSTDFLFAYTQVRSAGIAGWDDAHGMYVGTQMGRMLQLYRVDAPGADRRQATFFPSRMAGCYLNPMAARKNFLYTL